VSTESLTDLINKARAFAGQDDGQGKGTHPYFAPSDEPLTWQTKGKVVRLDVAIYALHVFAARVAFRSFAGQMRQQWVALERAVATWVTGKAVFLGVVKLVSKKAAQKLVQAVTIIEEQFRIERVQQDRERAIRRQSLNVQRDVLKNVMGQSKRQRRTRLVLSRHPSPPQRKPNKSWKP